jgi:hypothetical protein
MTLNSTSPQASIGFRSRLGTVLLAGALLLAASTTLHAEMLGQGPVLAGGYISEKQGSETTDLGFALAGWGWRMAGPDSFAQTFEKLGMDFSWKVEALGGAIFGDSDSVEASVVPYFLIEQASAKTWIPYLEGGIGLIYNDLRGYDLGSQILFSDNIGFGVAHENSAGSRWTLGYRLRHISHASLWADSNDGLNTHFIVFGIEK